MKYLILTETEFFGLIDGNDETVNLNAAYNRFVRAVVELMHDAIRTGRRLRWRMPKTNCNTTTRSTLRV